MTDEALETIRAFANTLDVEGGTDALDTRGSLVEWLVSAGLAPAGLHASAADLARARSLREAIRGLLLHNAGADLRAEDVAALDEQARRSGIRPRFVAEGPGVVLEPAAAGVDDALGRIVVAVAGAMSSGAWERLKLCRAEGCRWAFLDASRNHSRHWCAMGVCGNREKVRAYRARRERRGTEP